MIFGPKNLEPMYTTTEVAENLNVTRRTVYQWIKTGRLNPVKIGPKLWQISQTELDRFKSVGVVTAPVPAEVPVVTPKPSKPVVMAAPGFRSMPINPKKGKARR